jgi:hypothetical protein
MMGVGPTHSCRELFKQLSILPIPCVYIFSLMMFMVNNLDNFQPNNSMHGVNTRNKECLHKPFTHLSSFQKGVYYSGVKLFNSLPKNVVDKKHDKKLFKIVLCSYLLNYSFYSVNELLEQNKTTM